MSTHRRRTAPLVVAALAALAALWLGRPDATAASPAQDGGEARVRDLEHRSRDLEFRWRTLDNSERVEQGREETTVTFAADVLFEFDSAALGPDAQALLGGVAEQLGELGGRTVTIVGHTDDHGEPGYNQDLSVARAQAVEAALAAELGAGFAFDVSGRGEDEPVAPNEHEDGSDDPEGRALNRRVEITFPTG